jgi:ribosomal-protein-alanine N-acetyltransferase
MSAVLQTFEAQFEPLTLQRLDEVLAIEQSAYAHPWSRGNFSDSLQQGYQMQLLTGGQGAGPTALLGYFVAMKGVDEVHLLNITVAPVWQHQGWARVMLDALAIWARGQQAQWLWLEVRRSNLRAQQIYLRNGFKRVGERKGYYPDAAGRREDAVVMSLKL